MRTGTGFLVCWFVFERGKNMLVSDFIDLAVINNDTLIIIQKQDSEKLFIGHRFVDGILRYCCRDVTDFVWGDNNVVYITVKGD